VSPMETPYHILIVEDVPADAELNEREIQRVLTPCIFKRVETEEDFLRALGEFKPDFIISDYQMPTFDGLTALKLTLEKTPLTPFLLVTGSMNEETAVDCMKAGATDYVVKEHLKKLGPAIIRALEEKKIRMERLAALESLKESEEKFRDLFENANDLIQIVDAGGKYLYVNRKWCEKLGLTENEAKQLHFTDIVKKEQIPHCMETFGRITKGETIEHMEMIYVSKDGRELYLEGNMSPSFKDGEFVSCRGIFRDITERKKTEEALRASEAELHDAYFAEATINMILSESLKNIPFEEFLQKALNMILSLPWLTFESIGSISLVEDKADVLVMKAQSNLPEQLKKQCAKVPFGTCLCGLAALSRKIQFADHIDERHGICYEGMAPHGHYVVPLLFGGKTLGVINIHLIEGHIRSQKEEEFLLTVADTLAGIIVRKQGEEEKEKLNAQLLQAQKMEAVGQLAGGISHDFNNILTAMIGYGHLLKMKLKEDDPLRTYADQILLLSDRAANLTQSLKEGF